MPFTFLLSCRARRQLAAAAALFAVMVSTPVHAADTDDAAARDALDRAMGAALQTDMPAALAELRSPAAARLSGKAGELRDCLLRRFGAAPRATDLPGAPTVGEPWVDGVITAFHAYWQHALTHPAAERPAAEAALLRAMRAMPGLPPEAADLDALEPHLLRVLKERGSYALLGRTGPLRELMLWREQEDREQAVALPEGAYRVRVSYLKQFTVLGWADYATCGRRGTGGWATAHGLFAVVQRYDDLDGEEFAVSFLGHEAQHFADLTRHGRLPSWRLEYRAKLVELAQARRTVGRLLEKFTEDQSDDASLPHSHANRRVLRELRTRLGVRDDAALAGVGVARLNAAAVRALKADSAQLDRATVKP